MFNLILLIVKTLEKDVHTCRIACQDKYKTWIEGYGIEFVENRGDPDELMKICIDKRLYTLAFIREGLCKFWVRLDSLLVSCYKTYKGTNLLFESPSTMSGIHITEVLEIMYFRAFNMPWTQTREYPHVFVVPDHNMGSRYNYMSPTIVQSPLDWFELLHITGYWFLDKGKTSDDQDGDKSVICSEEGVRDAESSVDGPIKLIGEEIRLDLEYTKSLIKQHAQTSSQVMVKNLNPSPVCPTMVMTTSDLSKYSSKDQN
ncbi:hypothetical protein PPACK8108_LOCUS24887 [Phakopsora pachyrhizi]|uniref:Glycosyltransferase family 28 N-terminal domain-containing protein n=1 Tax=Phakopsora pachyrhizi TaxID=170000 RepID=A0AAV0BVW1_PHAPC|nr:hypothetical protein PPACK8108_LOCUS24887 [Phakopsora pachyrhizi]